jgi:hypothetical protein
MPGGRVGSFSKSAIDNPREYEGDGYCVSLIRPVGGWHKIIRSSWHRDVSSARARAANWSFKNANWAIREIGLTAVGEANGQSTARKLSRWVF